MKIVHLHRSWQRTSGLAVVVAGLFLVVSCGSSAAVDTSATEPATTLVEQVDSDSESDDDSADTTSVSADTTMESADTTLVEQGAEREEEAEPEVDSQPDGSDTLADPDSVEAADAVFEAYRAALLATDGVAAALLVTPSTVEWYDGLLELSIAADEEVLLNDVGLVEGLSVLPMRARIGDDLLTMNKGEDLFVRGVELGLVGDNIGALNLDRIVAGDDGEAFGVVQGINAFRFEQVDDEWKLDLKFSVDLLLGQGTEEQLIVQLTGGEATSRLELFEQISEAAYGSSWAELSQPLQ